MRLTVSVVIALVGSCQGAFQPSTASYRHASNVAFQSRPSTYLSAVDPNKDRLNVDDITAEADAALKSAQQSLDSVNGQQSGSPMPPARPPAPITEDNPALRMLQGFADKVGKFLADAAVNAANKVAEEAKAIPGKVADAATTAAKKQADNLVAGIQAIPVNIQNAAQRKAEETVNEIKAIPRKVQEAAAKKADETLREIEAIPSKITEAALDAADKLAEEAAATPGRIADSAQKAVTKAIDEVTALPRQQLEKLEAMLDGDKPQVPQPPKMPPPPVTTISKAAPVRKPEPPKIPPKAPESKPQSIAAKVEVPKLELPKIEAPKIDLPTLPKIAAPKLELPKVEPPKLDLPKVDTSASKKPAVPKKKPDDNFIFSEVSLKNLLNQDSTASPTISDKRNVEEEQKRKEAEKRKQEASARAAAAQAKAREAEAKRQAELNKKRQEEQARKEAIEAKRRAEAEAKRQQELSKKQQAVEAENARREAQRQAELERKQKEAAARQAAEEKKREEIAAKRQAELERKQQQAAAQKAAAEKARLEREAANKAALAKKQAEAEAKKAAAIEAEQKRLAARQKKDTATENKPMGIPFSSPSLRVAPSPKKPSQRLTRAPPGVSTIVRWRVRRDGGISGLVYGNPNFEDGERIETTKIVVGDIDNGCVVETGSGSRYFLSDTPPGGSDSKANRASAMKDLLAALPGATITLTRQTRDKDAKVALETVEQAKPRSTFSLFGNTAKIESASAAPATAKPTGFEKRPVRTAPRGVPSISKWKENRDGSITGLISGSPNFRDGERVTTSPIVSGRIAAEETVRTGSGSRYFLM